MSSMYRLDPSLPELPIPELSDTHQNLGALIRPLVDDGQYARTCRSLDAFFGGPAEKVQSLLHQWRDTLPGNASWLRPIWNDTYLLFRDRLPVNMNYGFELNTQAWGPDPLPRFIAALTQCCRRLGEESFEPESGKSGPLSMDMTRDMIYTRVPAPGRDELFHVPLLAPPTIAVVHKSNWFLLNLCDDTGVPASPRAIRQALDAVRREAQEPGAPVGALTAARRDRAMELRDALKSANGGNLEAIENTLFAVCLDGDEPATGGADMICGDAANRWFDKSLQVIARGGQIAINLEHAGCDASVWLFLLNQVDDLIRSGSLDTNTAQTAGVRRLAWEVPPQVSADLIAAREDFRRLAERVAFDRRVLPAVQKEAIILAGCSPDVFIQLLYQAAYYKLTGQIRSVYEAVAVRGYYQGRTECLRPVSAASRAFTEAFIGGETSRELHQKFWLAVAEHLNRLNRAQRALGSERHMTGLMAICQKHMPGDLPEIFSDPGYLALRHDTLSTSSTTAPFIDYFGFGPVVGDGLGIGYGLKRDGLHLMVASYPETGVEPAAFLDEVNSLAARLLEILLSEQA